MERHQWVSVGCCGVDGGNGSFCMSSAGAGVEGIFDLVVAMGWITETGAEHCGVGAGMSVLIVHLIHVTITQSSSYIVVKVQRVWDCCVVTSIRFRVFVKRLCLKVSSLSSWGRGQPHFPMSCVGEMREQVGDCRQDTACYH